MTPNTGPLRHQCLSDGVSALFNKIGPGILFTHSQGGGPGWVTVTKNPNVKASSPSSPGSDFVFPEGEVPPAPIVNAFDNSCRRPRSEGCNSWR